MKIDIDREPEVERRFGVELRASTAHSLADDPYTVYVRTEVRGLASPLPRDIEVTVGVYNAAEELLGVNNYFVRAESFVGREPLEMAVECSTDHGPPSKATLFVKGQ